MKLPEPPKISISGGDLSEEIAAVETWAMHNDPMWVNWRRRGEEEGWSEAEIYRVIAAQQLAERYRLQNELIEMVERSPLPTLLGEPNDKTLPTEGAAQDS